MGFFGSFFGSSQANDARAAYAASQRILNKGLADATTQLQQGTADQLNSLAGGYGNARSDLWGGYGQARQDINQGYDTARSDIDRGYNRAVGTQQDYLSRSGNILNPYIQRGQQAGDLYSSYMGLNGADAQQSAVDQYQATNPLYQEVDDRANQEMLRQLNSQGISGGRMALTMTRASQQRGEDRLNSYLNRLQGMYGSGQQASGQLAGYTDATGQRISGLQTAQGTALAGNETNRGTTLGAASMANGQNLSNLDYRYGTDQGAIQGGLGNSLANLAYGNAQQQAGNRINLGNAVAASRSTGINNLLGLGGVLMGGFSPSRNGTSTFGNMYNTLTGGRIV